LLRRRPRETLRRTTTGEGSERMSTAAVAEQRMSAEDAELVRGKRIVVVMPAYNAARTLELTWREIPSEWVTSVILVDDASRDDTTTVAEMLALQVIHHHRNVGYGGNQKTCYTAALREDVDVVVMLHPDGQYDPCLLPSLVRPVLRGEADMVLGSRFLEPGGALAGGMPLYKYVSNRFLTSVESLVLGQSFSELHTGYRAYSRQFLETIPYLRNANDFVFDTQVIAQAIHWRQRIVEVPVATKYFPEASSASLRQSLVYGLKTLVTVGRLALHRSRVLRSRLFSD
jgi:glycosyltransferase involved in cell wall biosynthesis